MSKRAAIYARFSTELQNPKSCEDQIALCRRYAEAHGITVVATYQDAATSGTIAARDGYQAMLLATTVKPLSFNTIICESVDRVWRDSAEQTMTLRRLKLKGVELIAVSQGISSRAKGAATQLAVHGLISELYVENVREKTHRGLDALARNGLSTGGCTYGYQSVPTTSGATSKRLEIDEAEAAIVRRIFEEYAAGKSYRTIAHVLNEEHVPAPSKGTAREAERPGWSYITVRWVLRNERYIGRVTWNKLQFVKDPDTGKRRPVPRPESEWLITLVPEQRIVSDALWNAVKARQGMIAERCEGLGRNRLPRAAGALYSPSLLNGLLRCAVCGGRMEVLTTRKQKNGRTYNHRMYLCSNAKNRGPAVCKHATTYKADELEADLLTQFRAAMTPDVIDRIAKALSDAIAVTLQDQQESPKKIAATVARLKGEAANLVRFIKGGGNSSLVLDELRDVETKIAAAEAEYAAASNQPAMLPPKAHRSWLLAKLERLHELLATDPVQAKVEIARHLDGNLTLRPLPAATGEKGYEIAGSARSDGLLGEEGAGRIRVYCGGRDLICGRPPLYPFGSVAHSASGGLPRCHRADRGATSRSGRGATGDARSPRSCPERGTAKRSFGAPSTLSALACSIPRARWVVPSQRGAVS
jgi:DNA invertase Pin-like site-specific DNA recombinase